MKRIALYQDNHFDAHYWDYICIDIGIGLTIDLIFFEIKAIFTNLIFNFIMLLNNFEKPISTVTLSPLVY